MKVLLVIPRRPSENILPQEDIGLAYVAAAAKNVAESVEVLDCHLEKYGQEDFSGHVKKGKYDTVAFRCLALDHPMIGQYADVVKEISPKIFTVAGGPHPSAMPEYMLKKFKTLDYCIRGEGELGLGKLLKLIKEFGRNIPEDRLKDVPGLICRLDSDGRFMVNKPCFTEELDSLDFPAWDLFDLKRYPAMPAQGSALPIITTRGCPGQCTFCCNNKIFGRRTRFRSIANVIQEVSLLVEKYNTNHINIFDDNFVSRLDFVQEFCEAKKRLWPRLTFSIPQGIRLAFVTEKLVKLLDNSSCKMIGVGIESGDMETLKIIRKGLDLRLIQEKLKILKRFSKIQIIGFFILGFPHETKAQIQKTINYALSLPLDFATFTLFTPFSGTELLDQLVKENLVDLENLDWSQMQLDRQIFKRKNIAENELKNMQRKAYFRFYFRYPQLFKIAADIVAKGALVSYLKRISSIAKK